MALRAVVFDYGMVLTQAQDPAAYAELLRLTGLSAAQFEPLYWADRHAYDEGTLNGLTFWRKFLLDAKLPQDEALSAELNQWDARMWTTQNTAMVDWQLALTQRGLLTAILSNMGDTVHESVERAFDWIHRFDVLVWSYQLSIAKPDPAIYRYTLNQLDTKPEETLFIDDKPENIAAAESLGMRGILFSTVAKLREDLLAAHLENILPLPAVD